MRTSNVREALEWLRESPKRQIGRCRAKKEGDHEQNIRGEFIQKILDAGAVQVSVVGALIYADGSGYADCLYIVLPVDISKRTNLLVHLANFRVLVEHVVDSPSVVAVTFL